MPTLTLPGTFGARVGAMALTTALTAAGVGWLGAPTAVAVDGDSGDIKVHREGVPPFVVAKDDPLVCRFYLEAANFDKLGSIGYSIQAKPPLPTSATVNGNITLVQGSGRTDVLGLADGQYQLEWTPPGGNTKTKIFRVSCRDENERQGAQGPGHQIEDQARGTEDQARDTAESGSRDDDPDRRNEDQEGSGASGKEDRDDGEGPKGGVHAGGGGLARTAQAFSPTTGAAAVGLVVVSGAVYFRLIRRRPHGVA